MPSSPIFPGCRQYQVVETAFLTAQYKHPPTIPIALPSESGIRRKLILVVGGTKHNDVVPSPKRKRPMLSFVGRLADFVDMSQDP